MEDAADLKSAGGTPRAGSNPAPGSYGPSAPRGLLLTFCYWPVLKAPGRRLLEARCYMGIEVSRVVPTVAWPSLSETILDGPPEPA